MNIINIEKNIANINYGLQKPSNGACFKGTTSVLDILDAQ